MKLKKIAAAVLAGSLMVSALSGCGMNKDAIVTKMGNEPVRLGMVNFMARYEQAAMDDLYLTYFGAPVWDQDLYGNGSTMAEETVNSVMDTLHGLMTLAQPEHMEEYGVSITEEEMAAINETTDRFMQDNSREALNEMGATKELVSEMLRLFTIKSKMHAAMIEKADADVTDEEANMRGYTAINTSYSSRYDSEQGSYVDYTEEEAEEIKASMQAVLDDMTAGASLEEAAEAHGFTTSYRTYAADDVALAEDIKAALDVLKEGEVTALITTDSNLFIGRLDAETDAEETEEHKNSLISSKQESYFSDTLATWQDGDGWEANINAEQLAKIVFKNLFTQQTDEPADATEGTEAE